MGYLHIENLYKNQEILNFKECYALEKIHGTSAHIKWLGGVLTLSPGGCTQEQMRVALEGAALVEGFTVLGHSDVTVYGELYGGSQQKMSATYGPKLKFIAFDVMIGDTWLNVCDAHDVAIKLDLNFVDYRRIPATMEFIDHERARPSSQAILNGMGEHKREGIVLRPVAEYTNSYGNRVICKHKNDEFIETATPRSVDPAQQKVLEGAQAIALEWVTDMRLEHVLQKFQQPFDLKQTGDVIRAMVEDVIREAKGEIVDTKEARKAIGERAGKLFRKLVQEVK